MKRLLYLLIAISLCSCTKHAEWFVTKENVSAWNLINRKSIYSWEGDTMGPLAHGDGNLVEYDKHGRLVARNRYEARCGVLFEGDEVQTPKGVFYGSDLKKNLPHGLGLLVADDSLLFLATIYFNLVKYFQKILYK